VAILTPNPPELLATMLRRYRAAAGLSQEELAERAALSRRCIADLERGARRTPYPGTLRRLADALGLQDAARAALLMAARPPRKASDQSARLRSPVDDAPPRERGLRIVDNAPMLIAVPRSSARRQFDIHYATRSDGARTAFGVAGRGPVLLIPPGWISHLEWWESAPGVSAFLGPLTEHRTVVLYDRHGCGLSHRDRTDFTAEDDMQDIEAVAQEFSGNTLDLFGHSWGALPAAAYAARHPGRVRRLVLYGSALQVLDVAPDAQALERRAAMAALRRADLELFVRAMLMMVFPSGADEDNFRSFVRIFRIAATPDMQEGLESVRFDWPALAEIQTQTLVLHRRDDQCAAFHNGEHCAQQIRGARFIPLEGDIHFPWLGDWQSVLTPVLEFLLGDDSTGVTKLAE
jgi:pimeloyl-ACP methyl ester carboxylesterase/DNA-binding XRE family transcriptional regulator